VPPTKQQPGHEHPAQALRVACVLRPRGRPAPALLLLARPSGALPGKRRRRAALDESAAGGFRRGLRPAAVLPGGPPAARPRPGVRPLLRAADGPAAAVLREPGAEGPGTAVEVAPRRGA